MSDLLDLERLIEEGEEAIEKLRVWRSSLQAHDFNVANADGLISAISGMNDSFRAQLRKMDAEDAREQREGLDRYSDRRPVAVKGAHPVYSGR